jgi:nucleoside-diphosphate-sugar epimerase
LPGGLDLCYVRDCAAAIRTVHTAKRPAHRIYNVGAGQTVTPADLLEAVAKAVPGAALPEELREATPPTPARTHMDISRLHREFGWTPRFSVDSGVHDYAEWLADHAL